MFFYLFLLFTVVPLVELALLVWIGQETSLLFTIGLVLTTGVIGAALARWQGFQTVERIRRELAERKMPTGALLEGLCILVAGALLVTPGILTDLVGFSLLVPPLRRFAGRRLGKWLMSHVHVETAHFSSSDPAAGGAYPRHPHDEIIDAEVITRRVEDDRQ